MSKSDTPESHLVDVCPECERAGFKRRVKKYNHARNAPDKTYWCHNCKTGFDDPVTRRRTGSNTGNRGGLGVTEAQLDAARKTLGIEVNTDE